MGNTRKPVTRSAKIDMLFSQAQFIARETLRRNMIEARADELEQAAHEVPSGEFRQWLLARADAVRQSLQHSSHA